MVRDQASIMRAAQAPACGLPFHRRNAPGDFLRIRAAEGADAEEAVACSTESGPRRDDDIRFVAHAHPQVQAVSGQGFNHFCVRK